ncbi:hypothetical protein GQ457_06G013190 [Hibiscus cannabinus]
MAGYRKSIVTDVEWQRAPRAITRIGCKAKVIVMSTNSIQLSISFSHTEHNHLLCPTIMRSFLRSNGKVTDVDIEEARALKIAGMRTSQIMNYFKQQLGGFQNIGFIRKDLSDYTCFGDIITFDTTYKANAYGRPMMPIVGVKHHHQTIVFAIAILVDETACTFEWMLRALLEAMFNKMPVSMAIDGDRATRHIDFIRAIKNGINDMRIKELNYFISAQIKPFPSTKLTNLEGSAVELYTRASFVLGHHT